MENKDCIFSEDWYDPMNAPGTEPHPDVPEQASEAYNRTLPENRSAAPHNSTHTSPHTADRDSQQFRPDPAEPAEGRTARRKRRPTLKAVMITVCVLILIVASALVFMPEGSRPFLYDVDFSFHADERPDPHIGPREDYRDFMEDYFSESTSETPQLPRAETDADLSMALVPIPQEEELSLQEIYTRCSPSIVAITATSDDIGSHWGSGVILSADGYIVTNAHIISGASEALVTLWDDREYEARLVGSDERSDLAVLKIDARDLPAAQFGNSADLQVGDRVVAIGNPLSHELRGTMTDGIISAISRGIDYNGYTMTLLQTNAAINGGNSGGALINLHGQVVGITNMKMVSYYSSIEGIGFAIPSTVVKTIADQLIADGHITGRPAIGVTVGPVPAQAAKQFQLPEGLYVNSVQKHSDAWAQGLRPGDIITHAEGEEVYYVEELSALLDKKAVGDTMHFTVFRDGDSLQLSIRLMDSTEFSS